MFGDMCVLTSVAILYHDIITKANKIFLGTLVVIQDHDTIKQASAVARYITICVWDYVTFQFNKMICGNCLYTPNLPYPYFMSDMRTTRIKVM